MKKINSLLALVATLSVGQLVEAKSDALIYKLSTDDLAKTVSAISTAGYAIEIQSASSSEVVIKINEGTDISKFIKNGEYFGSANITLQTVAGRCPPSSGPILS